MVRVRRQLDGILIDEAVREDLRPVLGMTVAETHDRHDVAFRKIASSVERHERRAAVLSRELATAVEVQSVGRVVGGKREEWVFRVCTATDGVSIPAIFRRQQFLLLPSVVVAVRPPVVRTFVEMEKLLAWQLGVILGCEEAREEAIQVAPSMLYPV